MGQPNVSGMVNDSQFQSLPPAQQRDALFQLTNDASFKGMSDGDTLQFVSKMRGTQPQPAANIGQISARPNATWQDKASNYLSDMENDVRQGDDATLPGKVLKFLGAKGTDKGVPQAVSNYIASPILGPIKTAQGVVEGNVGKTVGGIAQTATIPSSFIAPQAAEGAIAKIPSKQWAAQAINSVEQAAKDANLSVSPDASGPVAMRIKEVAKAGTNLPAPVKALADRVTKLAGKGPVSFQEARDIYSNATGRLAPDDITKLSPKMQFYLGQFSRALHQDIVSAATTIGQGPLYQEAMQNYRQASALSSKTGNTLASAAKYAVKGGLTAAGGYGGYKAAKEILGQ